MMLRITRYKKLLGLLVGLPVAMLLAVGCFLILSPKPAVHDGLSYSTAIRDRTGKLLRLTLSQDDKYRLWIPLKEVSPQMVESTLLYEDRYFYYHCGVNPISLLRAFWQTYLTGKQPIGASTITMQLARIRFKLSTRSVAGKLRQILKSLQIEWHYSKNEILEAYLNLAPYGGNIEGVGAASEIYFQQQAKKLTLAESLLLTVIPQSPYLRTPQRNTAQPAVLINVRSQLWERWLKKHPQDRSIASEILLPRVMQRPNQLPFSAPHLADAVIADRTLKSTMVTTMDLGLQNTLESKIHEYIERHKSIGIRNAAALLVDWRSMEVLSLIGSADFNNQEIQGQVNGIRAKRSPGSTLKPFIYALAFEQGLFHPMTMLKDAPSVFGEWSPENCDRGFAGPIHAREALIRSRNVPAVTIATQLTNPTLYEFLKNAGITQLRSPDFYGLALVLGGAEMTMEELVTLYAALANGGSLKPLRFLMDDPRDNQGRRVLSPESCWLVLDILKDAPRPDQGYDQTWARDLVTVSWKTGTSYSYRDAWCIGIFGPYVLAVWIGNFDGESNPAFVGREAAAPLFFEIIEALKARHNMIIQPIRKAGEIKPVEVCAVSGQTPGPYCRQTTQTWFIPGTSPISTCEIHRPVLIDTRTGFRVSPAMNLKNTRTEVFEFWPSDLLKLFFQAGIPRRVPPPWHPACSYAVRRNQGTPPKINSPRPRIVYTIRTASLGKDIIPFSAATDADAQEIFWFVNNAYLGTSLSTTSFFWVPKVPGEFVIQAVDNLGRTDSKKIRIAVVE